MDIDLTLAEYHKPAQGKKQYEFLKTIIKKNQVISKDFPKPDQRNVFNTTKALLQQGIIKKDISPPQTDSGKEYTVYRLVNKRRAKRMIRIYEINEKHKPTYKPVWWKHRHNYTVRQWRNKMNHALESNNPRIVYLKWRLTGELKAIDAARKAIGDANTKGQAL